MTIQEIKDALNKSKSLLMESINDEDYGFYVHTLIHEENQILVDYEEFGLNYENEEYETIEDFINSIEIESFNITIL